MTIKFVKRNSYKKYNNFPLIFALFNTNHQNGLLELIDNKLLLIILCFPWTIKN